MDSCDVLIIGGGPAGSTLAWKLEACGLDVLILDKRTFPRDKTCAGWITPAVIDALELDVAHYAHRRVLQPITRFVTGVIGDVGVHTDFAAPVSYGIRRFEFDDYLLRRCGSRAVLGEALRGLRHDGDGWVVNNRIQAPVLVGAGGHFCPVARQLGSDRPIKERVVTAQEIEFEMSAEQQRACRVAEDRPELYFCDDLKGYGWVFRKADFLNIGLGREETQGLREHVTAFCERLRQQGRVPFDVPASFHGHAYLTYPLARRPLVGDGVLLIGDAAGVADPRSGEGIRRAVESAILAAEAIVGARGDYQRARLEPYAARLTARFGKRLGSGSAPPGRPFAPRLARAAGHWLLRRKWFARHVVIDSWFLHRQQPPLA